MSLPRPPMPKPEKVPKTARATLFHRLTQVLHHRFPGLRLWIWKTWYSFFTWWLRDRQVLFLNYGFEPQGEAALGLADGDEPHRHCLQLYHFLLEQTEICGRDLLEVGCGLGGGASYAMRCFRPRSYVGLDISPASVRFCRRRHPLPGLRFEVGQAENLPFESASCDVVLNLESSHCYPDFARFLAEVFRVLRPAGVLLFADIRPTEKLGDWEVWIKGSGLTVAHQQDISEGVLAGLRATAEPKRAFMAAAVPGLLRGAFGDWSGVPEGEIYRSLAEGRRRYLHYRLVKPAAPEAGER